MITVDKLVRGHDEFKLIDSVTWTNQNDWRTLFSPSAGEAGEIWVDFVDTANSSARKFQKFYFQQWASTVSFAVAESLGPSAIFSTLSFDGTDIQIKHTDSSPRDCTLKYRRVTNVS